MLLAHNSPSSNAKRIGPMPRKITREWFHPWKISYRERTFEGREKQIPKPTPFNRGAPRAAGSCSSETTVRYPTSPDDRARQNRRCRKPLEGAPRRLRANRRCSRWACRGPRDVAKSGAGPFRRLRRTWSRPLPPPRLLQLLRLSRMSPSSVVVMGGWQDGRGGGRGDWGGGSRGRSVLRLL